MRDTNAADGAASKLTIASIESLSSRRTKRSAQNDDELSVNQQQHQHQRQRKIKKFIRKIGNNPNNTLSNTSDTNDKLNFKRSNNRNNNENTQETNSGDVGGQNGEHFETTTPSPSRFRPSKRRIVVPIRRNRVNHTLSSTPPPPTTTASPNPNSNPIELTGVANLNQDTDHAAVKKPLAALASDQKKKLYVKRRRITPKPFNAPIVEPSVIQSEPSSSELETLSTSFASTTPSLLQSSSSSSLSLREDLSGPNKNDANDPEISLEIVTRLTATPKTYTYVVTRVHDQQSEIISSTFVRDQTKTLTDTITHTIHNTDAAAAATIRPTETLKFARTLFA